MVLDAFILQHIQLCDWYTAGSVQCYPVGGCAGAAVGTEWANTCYPHNAWSSAQDTSGNRCSYRIETGNFISGCWSATLALGVRCVRM